MPGIVKGFLPLPSDLDLKDSSAVGAINEALRRLSAQNTTETAAVVKTPTPVTGSAQLAYASGGLTLVGGSPADITGATITLAKAGRYVVTGIFDILCSGAGDALQALRGYLVTDGTRQTQVARLLTSAGSGATVSQQWSYTAAAVGKIVKLQADKAAGTGASFVQATNTSISAVWIGA